MTSALRVLMRRMFSDCRSTEAYAFRRELRAIEKRLGPFDDVTLQYAAGVAVFGLDFQAVSAAVRQAQGKRARGKGRRPAAAAVERLKRRQGLSWQTYDSAMRRLEELVRTPPLRRSGGLRAALRDEAES